MYVAFFSQVKEIVSPRLVVLPPEEVKFEQIKLGASVGVSVGVIVGVCVGVTVGVGVGVRVGVGVTVGVGATQHNV